VSAEIGQEAPDFTLKSQTGEEVTLSQFRGQKSVVLVFIPFAFTGVCQGELCAIRDDFTPFESAGAQVLAVSTDTAPTLKQWADQQGWTFPTLSDFWPHGQVAKAYGAFNEERGCANRVTVVIGKDGTIVDRFESGSLGEARPAERYEEAMAKL
jgi:peroxiredoxin (alkyl hydroperoxide reductase subunit C)